MLQQLRRVRHALEHGVTTVFVELPKAADAECELAEAEYARDQIHGYGPDWRCRRREFRVIEVIRVL